MKSICSIFCICFNPFGKRRQKKLLEEEDYFSSELQGKSLDSTIDSQILKNKNKSDQETRNSLSLQTNSSSHGKLNLLESLFPLKYYREDEIQNVNYVRLIY